jgi:hypothetical protein
MWFVIALAAGAPFIAWAVIEIGVYLMLSRIVDDEEGDW